MHAFEGRVIVEDGVGLYFRRSGSGRRHLVLLNGFYLFDEFKHLAEHYTQTLLDGAWPETAEVVEALDPWASRPNG